MNQLTVNNTRIGYVEKPMYIYKSDSGEPIVIGDNPEITATGIIYLGVIYNLPGYHEWEEADTAYISDVDAGVVLTSYDQLLSALKEASVDVDTIIVDHELRTMILELELNTEEDFEYAVPYIEEDN